MVNSAVLAIIAFSRPTNPAETRSSGNKNETRIGAKLTRTERD